VARRAVQQPAAAGAAPQAVASDAATASAAGSPMPMAWGSGPQTLAALLAREAEDPAVAAALQAMGQPGLVRPPAPDAAVPLEVRLPREVRAMEQQVRRLVAERRRADAAGGLGAPQGPPGDEDEGDEDPELLAHIARTMAEARARGAPVPRAVQFVDRALDRARDARALDVRLEREASGLQPELEDALAAAEQSTAAAARAPRRLGHGPQPQPDPQP